MKRAVIISIFVVILFLFAISKVTAYKVEEKEEIEMPENTGMYVYKTTLRNADGTPFVMRGINEAHTWYKTHDEASFKAIAETGANCIRIVLADGEQWEKDSRETLEELINMAKQYKMVAIVELHDATGKDEIESLENASKYWIEMADTLKGTEDYCIVNIANEWVGKWDSNIWCKGYTEVIPRLREAGINNVIMVDAAGWGQYGKSIKDKGKEVFESDPNANTMFSVHMYGTAGKNERTITDNLESATKQELCICVGEFGYTHSDGEVDEDFLMQYCVDNQIGYLAWSWKGNSGGVEYLDLSNDWEGKSLSKDWGERAINGVNGIKETSVISSAF